VSLLYATMMSITYGAKSPVPPKAADSDFHIHLFVTSIFRILVAYVVSGRKALNIIKNNML